LMKILLLTDIPPCKGYTGGLFMEQLCRLLPEGSVACFAVVNPGLKDARISSDLSWLPIEYYEKPREHPPLNFPPRFTGLAKLVGVSALAQDSYTSLVKIRQIVEKAVEFGRGFGADMLWCLLEGQTMIRLALPVSEGLGVPLLTHVMDPPGWWLRAYRLDRISRVRVLKEFSRAMKNSAGCAAGSWAMAEQYSRDYGTRTVAVLPSVDARLARPPAERIRAGGDLVIGMAGQTYAAAEWHALIAALSNVGWRLHGRDVRIRLLGRAVNLHVDAEARVEFLGWHPQHEAIKQLSEVDVLYCPYWFDPAFETEARLSFPGKLSTYLAAGRPILYHGPEYSSPGRFLEEHDAAVFCRSLEPSSIIDALTRIASDASLYSRLTRNGRSAFEKHLTLASQRRSFAEFLQVEEGWLSRVETDPFACSR
jgi:glycosyltransferase involved in cell wall biosynthesis